MMEPLQECLREPELQAQHPKRHQQRRQYQLSTSRSQRSSELSGSDVSLRSGSAAADGSGHSVVGNRNSQNLDLLLERLHSDLGSFRLHGFRSLPLTQSSLSLQQQRQTTIGCSWRASSREDVELMENIAELDSLLDSQAHAASGSGAGGGSSSADGDGVGAAAAGGGVDDQPVFSPVDFRDSGGGGGSEAVNRGAKFRWSSFARCHRPSVQMRDTQMAAMTAGQMQALRRAAFVELNRIVREFCPPSKSMLAWFLPKLFKRQKSTAGTAAAPGSAAAGGGDAAKGATAVFGVPLSTVQIRCGQPLPSGVIHLMRQLRRCGVSAHGIFRRAGGRARVHALRAQLDENPDKADFAQCLPYDLADLVKLYLRELPECLITQKLSPTLMDIFTYVTSEEVRLRAMQSAVLLLADENREVLQALLYFLNDFADCAETTQMGASNLAVCLAPSLFYFPHEVATDIGAAPRRFRRLTGVPDPRDLADHRAATSCLTFMIDSCHQMFLVPEALLDRAVAGGDDDVTGAYQPLGLDAVAPRDSTGRRRCFTFADNHGQLLARECGHCEPVTSKWQPFSHRSGVQTLYKGVNDGHPLRLWKAVVSVEASAIAVLNKLVAHRPAWDPDVLSCQQVEAIDENSDVSRFGVVSPPAQPPREACVLRAWRSDSSTSHRLHAASVKLPPSHMTLQIHLLTEDWLVEQRAPQQGKAGSCRVTVISRVDLRGHTIDWYNRTWGHILARQLVHLKKSFQHSS